MHSFSFCPARGAKKPLHKRCAAAWLGRHCGGGFAPRFPEQSCCFREWFFLPKNRLNFCIFCELNSIGELFTLNLTDITISRTVSE